MKILVTGSNGFIGKNVCRWLKKKGCYVIGLGRHEKSLADTDEYVCCDLNSEDVSLIFEKIQCKELDAMVHLAADMRKEPYTVTVVEANCSGTQRLLELCQLKKVPVFVQLSSLPVIGTPVEHPITEKHPIMPPTVYHVTKLAQEYLANFADYARGLRTVSFRISAPVGIGINPKTIFPVFVNKAMAGEDLVLLGKGTRKQSYVHVDDIAQAIYKAILSENAHGVYNLSSHNLLSNLELAEKCVEIAGSDSKITFSGTEDPLDEVVWDVSLDKIERDMGYHPEVSIEECIQEMCDYIRSVNETVN